MTVIDKVPEAGNITFESSALWLACYLASFEDVGLVSRAPPPRCC